jgi:hypothetical protein
MPGLGTTVLRFEVTPEVLLVAGVVGVLGALLVELVHHVVGRLPPA